MNTKKLWIACSLLVITASSQTAFAQGLNWEGQTGALKGPSKSALIFGSQVAQQPRRIASLPVASIPTSLDYFLRVVPHLEGWPVQVDFALTQLAGKIAPGVDLNARARFAMGASYHF